LLYDVIVSDAQVSGMGTFQVHITTLRRIHRTTTTTSTVLRINDTVPVCRSFVRYCLTNYQQHQQPTTVPFSGMCVYGEETSPAWFGCDALYPNNSAVIMPFTFTWPVCCITTNEE